MWCVTIHVKEVIQGVLNARGIRIMAVLYCIVFLTLTQEMPRPCGIVMQDACQFLHAGQLLTASGTLLARVRSRAIQDIQQVAVLALSVKSAALLESTATGLRALRASPARLGLTTVDVEAPAKDRVQTARIHKC
jgi:hypothetical protein